MRTLTKGEIQYLKTIFGNSMNYSSVRIAIRPFSSAKNATGIVVCNLITTPNNRTYRVDYSNADASTQAWFVHEVMHIWQWQNKGLFTPWEAIKIFVENKGCYRNGYKYSIYDDFDKMNMEQQAAAIEDRIRVQGGLSPRNCKDFSDQYVPEHADYDNLLKSFDNNVNMSVREERKHAVSKDRKR